jgi:thioredoxin reductase (NADPH)
MDIKVYGADWCLDCVSTKKFLDSKGVDYEYIDIPDNKEAIALVEQINNGRRVIPTLIVDGLSYTNPGINGLMKIIKKKL